MRGEGREKEMMRAEEKMRSENAEMEIKIQRRRSESLRNMDTGREKDKETEEESNHLKGLKVSVRFTHCPAAQMNARVSSCRVCRDEK